MALILVTGASSGLGADTANTPVGGGHDVVLHARDSTRITRTTAARYTGVITGDLADQDEIHDVAQQAAQFGRFDTVIHNAAVLSGPDTVIVNTVAPYLLLTLSGWCRGCGDVQAGFGEAAVDEVGVSLDVGQSATEGALEVFGIGERGVGHGPSPQQ